MNIPYKGGESDTKTLLSSIIVVAMLAIPTVVCAPDDNLAAIAPESAIAKGFPDGPGFLEVGGFISAQDVGFLI